MSHVPAAPDTRVNEDRSPTEAYDLEGHIERELELLKTWISTAASAIYSFYHPRYHQVRRSYRSISAERDSESTETHSSTIDRLEIDDEGHTSALRAFIACHHYTRWLEEEGLHRNQRGELNADYESFRRFLAELMEFGYLQVKSSTIEDASDFKLYRDSHYLMAVSLLGNVSDFIPLSDEFRKKEFAEIAQGIRSRALVNARLCVDHLAEHRGGKSFNDDQIHDFITLHALRGLDAFIATNVDEAGDIFQLLYSSQDGKPPLLQQLYDQSHGFVPRLLGYHLTGMTSRSDPVELAFGIALLNRLSTVDQSDLLDAGIRCVVESQLEDGAWAQGRLISYHEQGHPYLPSFEVGLVLTQLLSWKIKNDDFTQCEMVLKTLAKSFRHIRSSYSIVDEYRGWSNDHARLPKFVESWATAVVLEFLINYRDALLAIRQKFVLRRFTVFQPRATLTSVVAGPSQDPSFRDPKLHLKPFGDLWPDLEPAFRRLEVLDQGPLKQYWEPRIEPTTIQDSLSSQVIAPIERDWIRRPGEKCRSFILWGSPGTGKTSLVENIAQSLGWPLVVISPPDFLRHGGLEGFETAAKEIFHDLSRLRRVVVLFDECEEFFKDRGHEWSTDRRQRRDANLGNRTIGAFITSGMLPRLQSLHKNRWTIHVLATNTELSDLDKAVRRPGRFDAAIEIPHPELAAQLQFVDNELRTVSDDVRDIIKEAIRVYEGIRSDRKKRYGKLRSYFSSEVPRSRRVVRTRLRLETEQPEVSFAVLRQVFGDIRDAETEITVEDVTCLFDCYLWGTFPTPIENLSSSYARRVEEGRKLAHGLDEAARPRGAARHHV
ncbi:hypothetical protein BH09CHL1_BH09CHL1_22090 [soil metagenome]